MAKPTNETTARSKTHSHHYAYSKTCVKRPLSKRRTIGFKTNYHLMQVKSIAEWCPLEHSAILSTFIKLPFAIKTFDLSIFEWPFYTGFTVCKNTNPNLYNDSSEKSDYVNVQADLSPNWMLSLQC